MIELVGKLPGKCLVTEIYKQPCIEIAKLSTTSAPKFDVGDRAVVSLVSRLLVQYSTQSYGGKFESKSMFSIVY